MPKINSDKIKKELSKGTPDEQYSTLSEIKDFVYKNMEAEQKAAEDKASELASKMDKLNNGK